MVAALVVLPVGREAEQPKMGATELLQVAQMAMVVVAMLVVAELSQPVVEVMEALEEKQAFRMVGIQ
ncbi:MAG: hypothetical protein H6560_04160 [Lewinellaceae bacterium]|nr:hypothetical protein [Lewinellaceae bacterium]